MILGSLRFRIGMTRLDKFLDVLDFVISVIEKIFVRYMCSDKVIRSCVLNILLDVLHLEVHHI